MCIRDRMKKIRTLIVGTSGLVGGEVLKCVSKENQEIILLSRRTQDIVQENCSEIISDFDDIDNICLLYTSPSPRDRQKSRMPSSA